jgi:hypothetical protein
MYDSQNGETDRDRGLPQVYDARWRQPVRLKKDGRDETVAIRESSNVDSDFAADTVQEP